MSMARDRRSTRSRAAIFSAPPCRRRGIDDRGGVTFWGEVIDPDGDCELKLQAGDLVCDVPGTLHDLNIDIEKNNAPRVVRVVDGDFVATVQGRRELPARARSGPAPRASPTMAAACSPGSTKAITSVSSAERCTAIIASWASLAFESRERGTRTAAHNKGGSTRARTSGSASKGTARSSRGSSATTAGTGTISSPWKSIGPRGSRSALTRSIRAVTR